MGHGFLIACIKSRAFSFKAPERVIVPKIQGINGLSLIKKTGSIIPKLTPKGAKKGMILSRNRFIREALAEILAILLDGIWLVCISRIIADEYASSNIACDKKQA